MENRKQIYLFKFLSNFASRYAYTRTYRRDQTSIYMNRINNLLYSQVVFIVLDIFAGYVCRCYST